MLLATCWCGLFTRMKQVKANRAISYRRTAYRSRPQDVPIFKSSSAFGLVHLGPFAMVSVRTMLSCQRKYYIYVLEVVSANLPAKWWCIKKIKIWLNASRLIKEWSERAEMRTVGIGTLSRSRPMGDGWQEVKSCHHSSETAGSPPLIPFSVSSAIKIWQTAKG